MMKAFDPISHSINHHASRPRLNARESVCLIFYDFVSTIPTVAMTILYEHIFYCQRLNFLCERQDYVVDIEKF